MASTWTPVAGKPRSTQALQAVPTEVAPTLANEGIDLSSLSAVAVYAHAPNGQTFDGTGTLLAYVWRPTFGWKRFKALDYDMGDAAGLDLAVVPPFTVPMPVVRFAYVPLNVGVSGGAQITTDYVGALRTQLGEEA